jgi:hypothetical protein
VVDIISTVSFDLTATADKIVLVTQPYSMDVSQSRIKVGLLQNLNDNIIYFYSIVYSILVVAVVVIA